MVNTLGVELFLIIKFISSLCPSAVFSTLHSCAKKKPCFAYKQFIESHLWCMLCLKDNNTFLGMHWTDQFVWAWSCSIISSITKLSDPPFSDSLPMHRHRSTPNPIQSYISLVVGPAKIVSCINIKNLWCRNYSRCSYVSFPGSLDHLYGAVYLPIFIFPWGRCKVVIALGGFGRPWPWAIDICRHHHYVSCDSPFRVSGGDTDAKDVAEERVLVVCEHRVGRWQVKLSEQI